MSTTYTIKQNVYGDGHEVWEITWTIYEDGAALATVTSESSAEALVQRLRERAA